MLSLRIMAKVIDIQVFLFFSHFLSLFNASGVFIDFKCGRWSWKTSHCSSIYPLQIEKLAIADLSKILKMALDVDETALHMWRWLRLEQKWHLSDSPNFEILFFPKRDGSSLWRDSSDHVEDDSSLSEDVSTISSKIIVLEWLREIVLEPWKMTRTCWRWLEHARDGSVMLEMACSMLFGSVCFS